MEIEKIGTFSGHRDCVYTLLHPYLENYFFSASGDGMVVKWHFDQPETGELFAKFPNSVYAMSATADKSKILIGQNFEGIHLIDVKTKIELKSLKITESYIFDIFSINHIALVACGDGKVIVVDVITFSVIEILDYCSKSARTIAHNITNNTFAVGYSDNKIRIFDCKNFNLIKVIDAHTISVFGLSYTPDYQFLVSVSRDANIKLWDCNNDYILNQFIIGHLFAINHICFSPSGYLFLTCSMDKSIKIWDSKSKKLLKVVDKSRHAGHGTSVNKTIWVSNESFLSCSDDKQITLWKIKS